MGGYVGKLAPMEDTMSVDITGTTREDEIQGAIMFIGMKSVREIAEFIVSLNEALDGLQKNNEDIKLAYRKLLDGAKGKTMRKDCTTDLLCSHEWKYGLLFRVLANVTRARECGKCGERQFIALFGNDKGKWVTSGDSD